MTLLLTRPHGDNEKVSTFLSHYGIETLTCPLLNVFSKPIADEDYQKYIASADCLIITSKNAIKSLKELPCVRAIFVVGDRLAEKIVRIYPGISVHVAQTALSLLEIILASSKQGRYVFVSGNKVTLDFSTHLKRKGVQCSRVIAYQTLPREDANQDLINMIQSGSIRSVAFFSKYSAQTYVRIIERQNLRKYCHSHKLFMLSKNISEVFKNLPVHEFHIAPQPTIKSLCSMMVEVLQKK
ncbi:MAG: hypothetical protein C0582_02630 [Alphaproteobacteria bacterium]|nr:MAG: hypothetical protein C0582_02630 [Alphaproteobacteria bacterium]